MYVKREGLLNKREGLLKKREGLAWLHKMPVKREGWHGFTGLA